MQPQAVCATWQADPAMGMCRGLWTRAAMQTQLRLMSQSIETNCNISSLQFLEHFCPDDNVCLAHVRYMNS